MEVNNKYYCIICNKKYKSYHTLWIHNNSFHEKQPRIKEYKCKVCEKLFDTKQKKYYHQNKCTEIKNENLAPSVATINNNITNNSGTINNGTVNNNITINNYNNDNLEYISEIFKEKLFNNLLKTSDHSIPLPKLIENIKFNPHHKENHNVKITSDRSKIGFHYDQNKWKAINKNELLDDLCNYSLKILSKYFEEKKESLSDDILSQYKTFSHIAKLKSELRNEIKEKIENIAYIFTKNNEIELDV
jgi:hypothetical protein